MPDDPTRADLERELHYMQTQVEQHGYPGTRAVLAELERLSKENARLRQGLGQANDRVDAFLSSGDDGIRAALVELADTAEWYVRCLDDVRAHRPVHGLDEAEAAYSSAMHKARGVLPPNA